MEEIFDIFKRTVSWLILDIVYYRICYYIGWVAVKVFTVGRFTVSYEDEGSANKLSLLGFAILAVFVLVIL